MIAQLKKAYTTLIDFASSLESVFLLLLRLIWGYLFFKAGLGKLENISQTTDFFYSLGIPFPEFSAHLVGYVETIGGICLMAGFATRFVSLALIITMVVAFLTAHIESIRGIVYDPSAIFKDSPFTFLFATLVTFIFGPGKYSFDQMVENFSSKKK